MIYLSRKFINLWFLDALTFFLRLWTNIISLLEEDLAVGLMVKLLFVPLFHDSSWFGKIMSFIFRSSRILIGLFAFTITSLFILILCVSWFLLPFLVFIPSLSFLSLLFKFLFILVILLFIRNILTLPSKKIWQLKSPLDLWQATKLKKQDLGWDQLLNTAEVKDLVWSLEKEMKNFTSLNLKLNEYSLGKVLSLAKKAQAIYITPAYFFVAEILSIPMIDNLLLKMDLTTENLEQALNFLEYKKNQLRKVYIWDDDFAVKHLKGVNRGWLGAPTPFLDSVSTDLTRQTAKLKYDEFVGRDVVVSRIVNILSKEKDRNVVIIGPPGAGKTSLVSYLATKIIAGDAPSSLATKRLVSLEPTKLLSGIHTEGELAEKVKNIFEEVEFVAEIIIFVDEIHNLGVGESGVNFNLYGLMMPYLESGKFQFIATTEAENYARILEKNSSFARVFTKVELPPATEDETKKIIFKLSCNFEQHKSTKITYIAIDTLVSLSAKLIHDKVLPDSALSVLAEAQVVSKEITSKVIKKVLSKRVNVPLASVGNVKKAELLNLEGEIHQKLIDQDEAVGAVGNTLRRSAVSLREQTRPIGSFLFVGPTGVGKTELAKILAEVYFKDKSTFLRFDMSEYQTGDLASRLIGNLENPGELTEAVKNRPYALLLLDEFEKASPQILNLFLQVLDDGRLTDASGKTVDFTNTIIIATSNAASLLIAQGLEYGQTPEELNAVVKEELLKVLKPELVNRFDEIVIFKPLSHQDLEKIVKIKLADLAKILKDQGFLVEFTPELVSELARKGFDPVLGARPLRRLIQDTLEARFSVLILEGKLAKGENIEVGVDYLQ